MKMRTPVLAALMAASWMLLVPAALPAAAPGPVDDVVALAQQLKGIAARYGATVGDLQIRHNLPVEDDIAAPVTKCTASVTLVVRPESTLSISASAATCTAAIDTMRGVVTRYADEPKI